MSLLVIGASYATQAQRRGHHHHPPPPRPVVVVQHYDDDCYDDRRGRGRGHYKHRDYRRDDCRERVVVVRPRYPYPPPPPPPRRPGISGVIVFNR
ncbi:hypothetical protein [Chitinophaga niabensis]|uniref:hypothetical protein n=1 Tax=Chitinophaga niabensis TaxID=536979 RepID=UPI001160E36B|nr:hypothetical protein [Chitinophaga niabensis]